MPSSTRDQFISTLQDARASGIARPVIPLSVRVLADQLTPVLAYRRLVSADERTAPSFLLESVDNAGFQSRYSILGAKPTLELSARANTLTLVDHSKNDTTNHTTTIHSDNPFDQMRAVTEPLTLIKPEHAKLPDCVLGGWFGSASYDAVRYLEPTKLPFESAPNDDRALPDVSFAYYDTTVIFDHVEKTVSIVRLTHPSASDNPGAIYDAAVAELDQLVEHIQRHTTPLPLGRVEDDASPPSAMHSNTTRDEHAAMVARAKEDIHAGDIFQVVLGQRFERRSDSDPFDVYRALRAVNPSPYMVYMQTQGSILVASSPEILCRVRNNEHDRAVVTNRPLAGTRKRGRTEHEDLALEQDLLADPKERAEHAMLVDLGRNDVGRVAEPGTVSLDALMDIERYSHVMHISSTVSATIREPLDCYDALRAALPVGTISGAPKIRAMQIIDELEKTKRGPYGGGLGWISPDHQMDIALALRTIVVPLALHDESHTHGTWMYHVQAAGGIVADSNPDDEYQETVNKAAALSRAIDLAERAFLNK